MTPTIFHILAWTPIAVWIATEIFTRGFEGWGRWAAAPMFLIPMVLSAALIPVGLRLCRDQHRAEGPVRPTAVATLIAAAAALWFLARALYR